MFKYLLTFLITFTLFNKASAQTDAVNFDYIKIENSGIDVPISSIYRDRKGYMWFGSNVSRILYQYDGYDFKKFRNDPENPKSLSSEAVFDFTEDKNGSLWVSTYDGLNRFNRKSASFDRFNINKATGRAMQDNFILRAGYDQEGTMWIKETTTGIYTRRANAKKFSFLKIDDKNPFNPVKDYLSYLHISQSGRVWYSIDKDMRNKPTLFCYNSKIRKTISYSPIPGDGTSLAKNKIFDFFEDTKENLWLMLNGGGMSKLSIKTGKFTHFFAGKKGIPGFPKESISSIAEDGNGLLWIGTPKGLYSLNSSTNRLVRYSNILNDSHSLRSDNVHALYNDKKGILWVGTDKGLCTYNYHGKRFQNYLFASYNAQSLNSDTIHHAEIDKKGIVWYLTGKGLYKYNRVAKPQLVFSIDGCNKFIIDKLVNLRFYLLPKCKIGLGRQP